MGVSVGAPKPRWRPSTLKQGIRGASIAKDGEWMGLGGPGERETERKVASGGVACEEMKEGRGGTVLSPDLEAFDPHVQGGNGGGMHMKRMKYEDMRERRLSIMRDNGCHMFEK
ncbi:hypothetical protein L1987_03050 [Smallanthus sonchifolius]|uniref:Uncharacterized protein n=1 Tax=Smallanthus sonchifolius TaxID=185202 RepID=A0ACB9K9N4_9ASTR|nr:hypothetical protein L1987_03050 [Smallanthus sonchifolius]